MSFFDVSMLDAAAEDVLDYPMPGNSAVIVRAIAAPYQQMRDYSHALEKGGKALEIQQAKLIATCIVKSDSNAPAFASVEIVQQKMAAPGTARIMVALLMIALQRNGVKDEMPEEAEKK